MRSRLYKEFRARYRVWDLYLGAFLIALILIGGAYAHVKSKTVVAGWDSLDANQCLIP